MYIPAYKMNKWASTPHRLRCYQINWFGYDLDVWLLTLKTFSIMPTYMMNWNPSTKQRDIASWKMGETDGWRMDGRMDARPKHIMPLPCTVVGGIHIWGSFSPSVRVDLYTVYVDLKICHQQSTSKSISIDKKINTAPQKTLRINTWHQNLLHLGTPSTSRSILSAEWAVEAFS